jgi:hypothetical protein
MGRQVEADAQDAGGGEERDDADDEDDRQPVAPQ